MGIESTLDELTRLLTGKEPPSASQELAAELAKMVNAQKATIAKAVEHSDDMARRLRTLQRKAQNQNDRSWNRALRAARVTAAQMDDLRKPVRHAGEFGED